LATCAYEKSPPEIESITGKTFSKTTFESVACGNDLPLRGTPIEVYLLGSANRFVGFAMCSSLALYGQHDEGISCGKGFGFSFH
jgi:hypothetical protein